MSHLPKLNAKIGGGLGGIPERKKFTFKLINHTNFIIPDNVSSVSIICAGGGGGGSGENAGNGANGAGGGGLSYINNVKVKPGDIITTTIGKGGNGGYGRNGGTAYTLGQDGGTTSVYLNGSLILSAGGGSFNITGGTGNLCNGGNGGYVNGGGGAGGLASGYLGIDNNTGISGSHVLYGAKGGNGGYASSGTAGQDGGCHIIFGEGRAYPNTKCHNFFD